MARVIVSPENWIGRIDDAFGIDLDAGTYVAGQLLVETAPGVFGAGDVVSTNDAQRVIVLRSDVTTATDGTSGVAVVGEFKKSGITFNGTQTADTLAGALQAKGIFLKEWMGA